MGRRWVTAGLLCVLLASLWPAAASASQSGDVQVLKSFPGRTVPVRAGTSLKPLQPMLAGESWPGGTQALGPATADIQVTYTGFSAPAQAAFEAAVVVWEHLIVSPKVINVNANWTPLGAGVLGSAGANEFFLLSDSRVYPAALAEALCNCEAGVATDINANFNSAFAAWYLGTDGAAPAGQYDLFTVVLHELGHGLGFMSSVLYSGGTAQWGFVSGPNVYPMRYDLGEWSASTGGNLLTNTGVYANPSTALGTALTNNSVYFQGTNVNAVLGGRAKLYAPSPWSGGSSNSHFDEATFAAGTQNALMTPQLANGEVIHHPGPLTLALFRDIGWTTASIGPAGSIAPTTKAFGNQTVGTTSASQSFELSNTGASALHITTVVSGNAAMVIGTNTCTGATVAPLGSCFVHMTFQPTSIGAVNTSLTISSSDAGATVVSLSGTGTQPVASLDVVDWAFGDVQVGSSSASKTFTLTNAGNATLTVSNVTLSSQFAMGTNTCGPLPKAIAPAGSCSVAVTFAPTSQGAKSGSLSFTSNAPGSPTVASLSGNGTAVTDSTGPTVQAPSRVLIAPQTLGTTVLLRVSWPAATDPSGIASYELQRKKGTGAWVPVVLPALTSTSVDVAVTPGAAYAFRLRATDGATNTGAWATTTKVKTSLFQETALAVTYTGTFKRPALAGASGGYVRQTSVAGRIATLAFSGRSAAFVTTLGPARGITEIRLDGGSWTPVDLYSATLQTKRIVWAATFAAGAHTVEVRVTGTKNVASTSARVDVDAFLGQP
ncbi:MAG TPA: choice-of-anchor D domain-containing protein [Glaciibacter sp.]|nr:choice-of-anchor D domain-containing protein [Glaciibacter sp.]